MFAQFEVVVSLTLGERQFQNGVVVVSMFIMCSWQGKIFVCWFRSDSGSFSEGMLYLGSICRSVVQFRGLVGRHRFERQTAGGFPDLQDD